MSKLIDFKSPPIIEVVVGATFDRLENFHVPHFGKFWEFVKGDFPVIEDKTPILRPNQEIDLTIPLIRTWFTSDSGSRLVQLQQDRIIFNWRKLDKKPTDYPEFEQIFPSFQNLFGGFQEFLKNENIVQELPVLEFELSYINIIPYSDLDDLLPHIGDLFVDHMRASDKERFLPEADRFSWTTFYPLPDENGVLIAEAKTAFRTDDPEQKVIRFTLSAKGIPAERNEGSVDGWFELAHNYIVNGFVDLTDLDVQQKSWERK